MVTFLSCAHVGASLDLGALSLKLLAAFWFRGRRRFGRRRLVNLGVECSSDEAFSLIGQTDVNPARYSAISSVPEYHFQGVTGVEISGHRFVLLVFPPEHHARQRRRSVRGYLNRFAAQFLARAREENNREAQVR